MESKIAGMIGAAALAAVGMAPGAAVASPEAVLQAGSFAELLQPIPNASILLAAVEAQAPSGSGAARAAGGQQLAYHHHHHHHHRWQRRRWHHHHHHHWRRD